MLRLPEAESSAALLTACEHRLNDFAEQVMTVSADLARNPDEAA